MAAFFLAVALPLCPAFAPSTAMAAETIVYDNGGWPLQTIDGVADSLAPSGSGDTAVPPNKSASLSGNSVTLNSGTVGDVYGAANGFDSTPVSNNQVFINGGTVNGTIYGVSNWTYAGPGSTMVTDNQVFINGGTVDGVLGGQAFSDSGPATATGNNVTVSGGTVNWWIIGGDAYSNSGSSQATSNTVTITGSPVFHAANTYLYGGYTEGAAAGDAFTGNTLNLHSSNLAVGGLQNFQFLNFYLPADLGNGGTMLTVTDTAQLSENADGSGRQATVSVGIDGASSVLKVGEQVKLIDAGTLIGSPANAASKAEGMQGVTLNYTFDITTAGNQLLATVASVGVNEQSKSLSEGFLAGPALVNQTIDLLTSQGIGKAVETAGGKTPGKRRASDSSGNGLGVFGTVAGGWNRYNTGSNVDMSSLSLLAGMSMGNDLAPGRLTLGAFVEYGNGWYDTYNSFASAPDARGKGDIYHLGGGILGHLDFNQGLYTEASLRAGGVSNDYKNGNLNGQAVNYNSDSAYYQAVEKVV